MSRERLNACPFCGGEAYVRARPCTGVDDEGCRYTFLEYYVACDICEARSKRHSERKTAIEEWNRRVPYE